MVDWFWEGLAAIAGILHAIRWVFQVRASKMHGKSINPLSFWILTIIASTILAVYSYHLGSIVLPITLIGSIFVWGYNIKLELKRMKELKEQGSPGG